MDPRPAVLITTRYWRAIAFGEDRPEYQNSFPMACHLWQYGYTLVLCDARGSGASFGTREIELSANEVAEWNFYIDPQAAALVFKSGAPLTLVPLDATNHVPLSIEFYNRFEVDRTTSVAEFVFQVLAAQEENVRSGWYYFWDPLAAAVVRDEDLVSFQDLSLEVIEAEGPESGWTKKSAAGSSLRVALTADRERFESLFLDVINDRLP